MISPVCPVAFADSGSISKNVIAIKPFTNEPFIILRFFDYVDAKLYCTILGYKNYGLQKNYNSYNHDEKGVFRLL